MARTGKKLIISFGIVFGIAIIIVGGILVTLWIQEMNTNGGYMLLSREEAIPAGAIKYGPSNDLYPPILHNDSWEEPVPLSGYINTAGAEDAPFISFDGQYFFFFFTPNASIPANLQVNDGSTGIWWSEHNGTGWSEPKRVFLGWDRLDGCPFFLNDTLWFCSVTDITGPKMHTALLEGTNWINIQEVCSVLNEDYCIGEMHLSVDGKKLFYHANVTGGKGDNDLWMTEFVGGEWQTPMNIETVNTAASEALPFLTADGQELWFTRTYLGTPGIFRSLWNGTHWDEPELILSQFAGEPTLDPEGNIYFVHHFVKDAKILEADIYVCYKK
jgi:hypothetical protein